MALTTIGIPVYNEGNYIQKTLESVDGQADVVIICDNASTDGTSDVCADFAHSRPYVRYERAAQNKGASKNFSRCLELADTPYFMWVGGHDLIEPSHVANLRKILDESDAVLAYANALHVAPDYSVVGEYEYTFADALCSERPEIRLHAICAELTNCTIFHGLYRREVLERAMKRKYPKKFIVVDHIILADIAVMGKMLLQRQSRYIRLEPRDFPAQLERWTHQMRAGWPELPQNPLRFPKSVYEGTLRIIEELEQTTSVNKNITLLAKKILKERWYPWFAAEEAGGVSKHGFAKRGSKAKR